jgi:hypothetical protein
MEPASQQPPEGGSPTYAHQQLRHVGQLLRSAAEAVRAGDNDRVCNPALTLVQLAKDVLRHLTEAYGTGAFPSHGESRLESWSAIQVDSFRLYSLVSVIEEALRAPAPPQDDLLVYPIADALEIAAQLAGESDPHQGSSDKVGSVDFQ